jgi:hypothetical protein
MFVIRTRPGTYQTGVTADGLQVIMGMWRYPWVVAAFFDHCGSFIDIQRRSLQLKDRPQDWYDPHFQLALKDILESWKMEIEYKDAPVSVKKFFLDEYKIGVHELPVDLQDYLDNPLGYTPEDREEFLKDIERWRSEGNFVFWWNANYHLDKCGEPM